MTVSSPPEVAKVFMSGRSQAVRLPKAFRFQTKEVTIERVGDAVVLRPKAEDDAAWVARLHAILSGFEGFPEEIERDRSPAVDDVESLD
ncbi:Antitoxin VapB2 [Tepidimonas fonticaldi]|uniref:Antitoxin VapB2 n=1 Tax=Tepidimonas fonticaldi TaxID=1101373 RepID=A0A554XR51_9BURK|nr:type II toxin-antitoxin system VapB family antitoxin [Tepidimonas fonticaldi]TSE38304.1 Antitoxin VapB2 [Tepidimonas fonticaldi]